MAASSFKKDEWYVGWVRNERGEYEYKGGEDDSGEEETEAGE